MARRGVFARTALALSLAMGIVVAQGATAATATGTLTVTARVGGYCLFSSSVFTFTSNFTLALGTYTPGGGNLDGATDFQVRCTNGVPFQVALSGGGAANILGRQMSATGLPAEKLAYQLYTNAARTIVWGDGSGGSSLATGTGGGFFAPRTFTVYGRVPDSGANPAAAPRPDYRDVVTITVTY